MKQSKLPGLTESVDLNKILNQKNRVKIIASKNSWIEGKAELQLQRTSELDGVQYCVGLPDIHPGRGNPVGAGYLIQGVIYPYLIGNDVGCGISLFSTGIRKNKISGSEDLGILMSLTKETSNIG